MRLVISEKTKKQNKNPFTGSVSKIDLHYTKEILKNTKEKYGNK